MEANDLPCVFIIEDNGRQVDTAKSVRRGNSPIANAPLDHFKCVTRYHYVAKYPHAGSGKSGITFNLEAVARHKARNA